MTDQETLQQAFDTALLDVPPKHRRLVHEFLVDLHQRNAAIRAGYTPEHASKILRNLKIRVAIDAGLALYTMPPGEVLARLTSQARGSMADILNDAGDIDLKQARDRGVLHLVKARSVTKEGERVELYDAQAALALLGKHHKLFTEKVEHSGKIDVSKLSDDELRAIAETSSPS